jgi:hypothetical protein
VGNKPQNRDGAGLRVGLEDANPFDGGESAGVEVDIYGLRLGGRDCRGAAARIAHDDANSQRLRRFANLRQEKEIVD